MLAVSDSQSTLREPRAPGTEGTETPSNIFYPHETLPSAPSEPSKTAPSPQVSFLSKTKGHLSETVRITILVEIELLILTFCIGIQDAISFPDYHCFASNQTGNTVFLAVALVIPSLNGDTFYTANIAVALGLFLAGGYLTGQLSHLVGPRRRGWLVLCNFLQTLLVLAAGSIQYHQLVQLQQRQQNGEGEEQQATRITSTTRVPPTGPESLLTIALLAFASGSQVVQSRSLRMTEISTAMATAAWVDLLIDPHLLTVSRGSGPEKKKKATNRPRNRRLAFLATLVAGSLVGAGIYRATAAGSAAAVFVSAGGKALVTVMYLFNGAEEEHEGEKEKEGGKEKEGRRQETV